MEHDVTQGIKLYAYRLPSKPAQTLFAYVPASQEPAIRQLLLGAGALEDSIQFRGSFASVRDILDDPRFANALSADSFAGAPQPPPGDFAIGGPTDPIIGTDTPGGFGVAFRNRLAQEGLGGLRGLGRGLQDPLRTIFETGVSGIPGATGGLFGTQEGREGFAQEDFISRALAGIRGGAQTIGSIASSIFGGQGTAEQEQFFAPNFAASVPGGAQNELAQARVGAELSRLAARQQFGTAFAQRLPSAFDLVEEFRAQPQGTGTLDFRDFLARRTQRGFTR